MEIVTFNSEISSSVRSISFCTSTASLANINVGANGNSSTFQWTPPSYYHQSIPYSYPQHDYSLWYGFSTYPSPANSSMVEQLPYAVKLLNNRIKKCRYCGSLFSRKADGSIPDPPNDLIIAHEERGPFADANNITRISRLQNVYYHPNVACIRRQHASFMGPKIQVPAEVVLLDL